MFCKTCGNELNDLAVVCPKCGCAVNEEKTKQKKEIDLSKLHSILSYVALAVLCLAVIFMVCSILSAHVNLGTSYYQYYDGEIAYINTYGYWRLGGSSMITSFVFSILGFLTSVANFILGFKKENKERFFRSTAIFMFGIVMMFLSVYGLICL